MNKINPATDSCSGVLHDSYSNEVLLDSTVKVNILLDGVWVCNSLADREIDVIILNYGHIISKTLR